MKRTRIAIIATLVTLAALCLTGCTTFDNFKEAFIDKPQDKNATIEIGVFEPFSGSDKDSAADEIKGIELAHEQFPTVNGKIINLIEADNASNVDAATTAIQTLIAKEPKVILGSNSSILSLAAGDYIQDAKIPTIAITNTNPLVTRNYSYYYRVCYVDSNQGDLMAQYVLRQGNEKAAGVMVPKGDDAALAMATAFTDRLKAETGNEDIIAVYSHYEAGASDYSKQLTAIRQSGAKCIFITGNNTDAANIINQAGVMGLDVRFLGDMTWGEKAFRKLLFSGAEENIDFVRFFAADAEANNKAVSEQRQKFLDAYANKYGEGEPSDAVALGYDAYVVAVDTIDKAPDDATGEQIREILADGQYTFEGASGTINFSTFGDPIKVAYICTWKGNRVTTVDTVDPLSE